MTETSRRRYDASGRRHAAQARRDRVVDVAAEMFATRGWAATTIPLVAAEAGVSVELVQRAFGTKGQLVMAALRRVSFGAGDVDLPTAFGALGLQDVASPAERLDRVVAFAVQALVPMAALTPVLAQAADQDPLAAEAVRDGRRRHLAAAELLVAAFVGQDEDGQEYGAHQDLVDEVYLLTLGETFLVLTADRGWSVERYAAWLHRSLARALGVDDGKH